MSSTTAAVAVGLKYCGGCKPDYDRVALVEEIQRRLGDRVAWVRADDPVSELILAVHGCLTACADLAPLGSKPVFAITGPGQAEAFIHYVETLKR
jgi:hypothetical protein